MKIQPKTIGFKIARLFHREKIYEEKLNAKFLEAISESNRPLVEKLLKKGVIIRDMGFWGLDTYIRVTIGTPQENKKFIKTLGEIL